VANLCSKDLSLSVDCSGRRVGFGDCTRETFIAEQSLNCMDIYFNQVKQGYDAIFQEALQQVLNSLRDKGLETTNPNFSCLGLQGPRPTDPNIENPVQYLFYLRNVELGRFWFTNVWTANSVAVTPHLTWVEGVDEIIERLL